LQTPAESARRMLSTLDSLKPADAGKLWAYDGSPIPF
jgi:hypothetical protein